MGLGGAGAPTRQALPCPDPQDRSDNPGEEGPRTRSSPLYFSFPICKVSGASLGSPRGVPLLLLSLHELRDWGVRPWAGKHGPLRAPGPEGSSHFAGPLPCPLQAHCPAQTHECQEGSEHRNPRNPEPWPGIALKKRGISFPGGPEGGGYLSPSSSNGQATAKRIWACPLVTSHQQLVTASVPCLCPWLCAGNWGGKTGPHPRIRDTARAGGHRQHQDQPQ